MTGSKELPAPRTINIQEAQKAIQRERERESQMTIGDVPKKRTGPYKSLRTKQYQFEMNFKNLLILIKYHVLEPIRLRQWISKQQQHWIRQV
jgi:hypothetical protein